MNSWELAEEKKILSFSAQGSGYSSSCVFYGDSWSLLCVALLSSVLQAAFYIRGHFDSQPHLFTRVVVKKYVN